MLPDIAQSMAAQWRIQVLFDRGGDGHNLTTFLLTAPFSNCLIYHQHIRRAVSPQNKMFGIPTAEAVLRLMLASPSSDSKYGLKNLLCRFKGRGRPPPHPWIRH